MNEDQADVRHLVGRIKEDDPSETFIMKPKIEPLLYRKDTFLDCSKRRKDAGEI